MSSQDPFLPESMAVADRLLATARQHRGKWNWPSRIVPYRSSSKGDGYAGVFTLNSSVYSGTAGIALYLARLHAVSGEARYREAAVGALEHAISRARMVNSSPIGEIGRLWRFGFYLGSLGVAWTATELSKTLGESAFAREGRRLVRELAGTVAAPFERDVIFGVAGAIPALLEMHKAGVPEAEGLAHRFGDHLLATGTREGETLSWGRNERDASGRLLNLTGFSHGAAGMAYSLTELYGWTGEHKYADAALRAYEYERQAFYPEEQNWPDFQAKLPHSDRYRAQFAWCHGAPGIGLSRVMTYPILKDARLLDEAEIARKTTATQFQETLDYPGQDWMACHGVAGNAETLWLIEEGLGVAGARQRAESVAQYGIERYGIEARRRWGDSVEWPTGVSNGFYPPLITGYAGIGYFLLRLAAPRRVPTALLPGVPMAGA